MNQESEQILSLHLEQETPREYRIFGIEGPVCAGKSSVIAEIFKGNNRILVIPEYHEMDSDWGRLVFPPQTEDQAQENFLQYLNLERARQSKLVSATAFDRVLLDRSIYTLLGFEAGAREITGIDILPWAANAVLASGLKLPDQIIYLDANTETISERMKKAGMKLPDFIISEKFNAGFRYFFKILGEAKPGYINFVSAEKPLKDLEVEIKAHLGSF